jgi:hypothetical protein
MRFVAFITLSLAFVASVAFSVPQAETCYTNEAPAYAKTKEALTNLKNAYLYIAAALINANPTHDEMIEATRYTLDTVEKLERDAERLNVDDPKTLRRKYYQLKLDALRVKINIAHDMVYVGVPSWPWLGKSIEWLRTSWNKIKASVKKLFHISESVQEDIDISEPVDGDLLNQGTEMANNLNAVVGDIDAAISEMDAVNPCASQ